MSTLPEQRRALLKKLLGQNRFLRAIEVHNGLSAIIASNAAAQRGTGEDVSYDALWISSLTDSASRGLPDLEMVSFDSRMATINEVMGVTNKPIIVDADTGGDPNTFEYLVTRLERLGVSALIVEDKTYPKRNSLDIGATHKLEDPEVFAGKISRGVSSRETEDFLVIARLESLIAESGMDDAVSRARLYLEAGASGIMIHSKSRSPKEVLAFAERYNMFFRDQSERRPLVCVPTTYNLIYEHELEEAGFDLVIYANHMLRSAHKAMSETAITILKSGRALEAETGCSTVRAIFDAVGLDAVQAREKEFSSSRLRVIIPAAGLHPGLEDLCRDKPCALLPIDGKTVIEYQLRELEKLGINDVVVIRGSHEHKIEVQGPRYYDVDSSDKRLLHSLFAAESEFDRDLLIVYSDIIFDGGVIRRILENKGDITVGVDSSYRMQRGLYKGKLDLVYTKQPIDGSPRLRKEKNSVTCIGKRLDRNQADAEFIGVVYLSKEGASYLRRLYQEHKDLEGEFHEAPSFREASLTDLLQKAIDSGLEVRTAEVNQGWRELHAPDDYHKAIQELGN